MSTKNCVNFVFTVQSRRSLASLRYLNIQAYNGDLSVWNTLNSVINVFRASKQLQFALSISKKLIVEFLMLAVDLCMLSVYFEGYIS